MFAALRTFATVVLLLASLSAQATSCAVVLHLVTDHGVVADHDHHDGEAPGNDHDADHGAEHSHVLGLAPSPASPTRPLGAGPILLPLVPVRHDVLGSPVVHAAFLLASPAQRAGPSQPREHSILLI